MDDLAMLVLILHALFLDAMNDQTLHTLSFYTGASSATYTALIHSLILSFTFDVNDTAEKIWTKLEAMAHFTTDLQIFHY